MTMLSFRIDEPAVKAAQEWAERLGVDRSDLLRDALRQHLLRLGSQQDAETWQRVPLRPEEQLLGTIAVWEPAEDWSDWSDAAR